MKTLPHNITYEAELIFNTATESNNMFRILKLHFLNHIFALEVQAPWHGSTLVNPDHHFKVTQIDLDQEVEIIALQLLPLHGCQACK